MNRARKIGEIYKSIPLLFKESIPVPITAVVVKLANEKTYKTIKLAHKLGRGPTIPLTIVPVSVFSKLKVA